MPNSFQVRRLIERWPHTRFTERVLVLPTKDEADKYAKERNQRLHRMGRLPLTTSSEHPYKEEYFVRPCNRRV